MKNIFLYMVCFIYVISIFNSCAWIGHEDGPDFTPPGEVTNLKASTPADGTVVLTWTDPIDNDLRYIDCVAYSGGMGANIANSTHKGSQTVTFDDLNGGLEYTFTLKTIDMVHNRSNGVSITVTTTGTPDFIPPGEVTNLKTSTPKKGVVVLTWTDPIDSDLRYIDCVAYSSGMGANIANGVYKGTQTVTFDNLNSGLKYTFTL